MEKDALQMIAEQKKIKNVIKAIMLLPMRRNGELIEEYMEIMEDIAFGNSIDSFAMSDNLDPLYQIAIQMKTENVIDAASYLVSASETLLEQQEYRNPLETVISSYINEKEKGKSMYKKGQ